MMNDLRLCSNHWLPRTGLPRSGGQSPFNDCDQAVGPLRHPPSAARRMSSRSLALSPSVINAYDRLMSAVLQGQVLQMIAMEGAAFL